MRSLVDRSAELALLREQRASAPSLVVLRGRRRIGKTFLLAHAFVEGSIVSYQADEQPRSVQLAAFAAEVARLLPGAPRLSLESWDAALEFLGSMASERPLVVVIDEFQYACASEPALPSIVQRHWDDWYANGTPICIVLSGSALTFMEGLLSRDAPLHGRATFRPTIEPLDYRDAGELAPGRSPQELIERYALLGGTPQYQVWAGNHPLERVVREAILRKGAPLYEEPLTLVREEHGIRDPRRYFGALTAIAAGRTRNAQIASLLELPSSNVATLLDRLAALGYVREQTPITPGATKRRRGFWQINDPFFRFWFRRVAPNRSRLDRGEALDAVWEQIAADLDTYVGRVFEEVCRHWVGRYSDLEHARRASAIGSWWSRDGRHEIDIACTDRHGYTLLGSCKWSRRLVDEDALERLLASRAAIEGRVTNARLILFARRGFTSKLRQRAHSEDVLLVTAAELFARSPTGTLSAR